MLEYWWGIFIVPLCIFYYCINYMKPKSFQIKRYYINQSAKYSDYNTPFMYILSVLLSYIKNYYNAYLNHDIFRNISILNLNAKWVRYIIVLSNIVVYYLSGIPTIHEYMNKEILSIKLDTFYHFEVFKDLIANGYFKNEDILVLKPCSIFFIFCLILSFILFALITVRGWYSFIMPIYFLPKELLSRANMGLANSLTYKDTYDNQLLGHTLLQLINPYVISLRESPQYWSVKICLWCLFLIMYIFSLIRFLLAVFFSFLNIFLFLTLIVCLSSDDYCLEVVRKIVTSYLHNYNEFIFTLLENSGFIVRPQMEEQTAIDYSKKRISDFALGIFIFISFLVS